MQQLLFQDSQRASCSRTQGHLLPLIYLFVNELWEYRGVSKVMSVHCASCAGGGHYWKKETDVMRERGRERETTGRDPDLEQAGRQEQEASCGKGDVWTMWGKQCHLTRLAKPDNSDQKKCCFLPH